MTEQSPQQPAPQPPYGQQPGTQAPYGPYGAAQPAPAGPKPKRNVAKWLIPIGAFVLGIIIGTAGGGGDSGNDTADKGSTDSDQSTSQIADLQGELDDTKAALADAEKKAEDAAGAQAALDQQKAELDAREAAITQAEAAFDANNLAPGMYVVGTDIQPGQYRGTATSTCYLGQNQGNDIMWNDIAEAGTWVQTVENVPGSVFEFQSACGNAQKIG